MQKWMGAALLLLFAAAPAPAQDSPRLEVSAGYTFVRANAPPGDCGCFSMNGGTAALAFNLTTRLGVVADFTAVHTGNVDATGEGLTLFSYLFGPRYSLRTGSRFIPFGEAFVGGAHASGLGYSGDAGPASAFAAAAGGGLDFAVSRRVGVRLLEADYYFTHFQNAENSRENNLRLSFGVVFRFGGG